MDFYMERENGTESPERYLMEVKGCTLDRDGIGYFPDAPTERGVKHLYGLAKASAAGYHAFLAFVIQMEGVLEVRPNTETHPEFAEALQAAEQAGVQVLHLRTIVRPDGRPGRSAGWISWRSGVRACFFRLVFSGERGKRTQPVPLCPEIR